MSTPTNDGGPNIGISELVARIGDENITVQNLAHNMKSFNQRKDHGEIAFATSKANGQAMAKEAAGIDSGMVALILWFPKDKLPLRIAARNQTTK